MKVAIRFAARAALSLICMGMAFAQQTPVEAAPQPAQTASSPAGNGQADPAKMAEPAHTPAPAADPSFIIGAEDVLLIQIWGDPRLSGPAIVRPDGRISINLIGEIMAGGLTPGQLEKAIADELKAKQILTNPQVTVQVTQINSRKYFLQGEVNKTGAYPLVVPTTVLEALVNAGGFRDFANERKIEVIRGPQRFRFNYKDVIKGKHTEQNIYLKPGDIIIVP